MTKRVLTRDEIDVLYAPYSSSEAAQILGVSKDSVRSMRRYRGINTGHDRNRFYAEDVAIMFQQRATGMSWAKIAKNNGIKDPSYVRSIFRRAAERGFAAYPPKWK